MPLTNFVGAVAVITGGASGIGLATARALYARGAQVILGDVNSQGLQQAEQEIRQLRPERGTHVLGVLTDVTNESQVQALMQQAIEKYGRIDLVVTCAGIGGGGPIDMFPASQMQKMMNINFMGTYHCVQAALPAMRQQGSGHFVLLSSVAGKSATPFLSAYCATKWAVRGFSYALRTELHGSGIGITTVYPAWVDTPMVQREPSSSELFNIEVLLTPDQVATEILQAVTEDRRDLTLAPNPDIALSLQLFKEDPDKAEMLVGEVFRKRLANLSGQQAE